MQGVDASFIHQVVPVCRQGGCASMGTPYGGSGWHCHEHIPSIITDVDPVSSPGRTQH